MVQREILPILNVNKKRGKISQAGWATPTKFSFHAFHINSLYLHEFFEPILFFDPNGLYRTRGFIGESNIWLGEFYIGDLSYHVFLLEFLHFEQWLCGRVHVVILILANFLKNHPLIPHQ